MVNYAHISKSCDHPFKDNIVTSVSTDKDALVKVVTATYTPSLVTGAKHLQADTESMLDHTILTAAFLAAAPRTTLVQPVKMLHGQSKVASYSSCFINYYDNNPVTKHYYTNRISSVASVL